MKTNTHIENIEISSCKNNFYVSFNVIFNIKQKYIQCNVNNLKRYMFQVTKREVINAISEGKNRKIISRKVFLKNRIGEITKKTHKKNKKQEVT